MLPVSFTPEYLKNLELFKIRSRRAYLGNRQGGHVSPKRGHGIEFSDYRQYELGDNPRHIDWSLFARSERLYVKRYQEEQNLSVLLVIDASASMIAVAHDKKWEMARDLALSLAYVALMEQDTVRVLVPGYFESPAYYGAGAIHQLGKALVELTPKIQANRDAHDQLMKSMQRGLCQVRFPGVAVVLSDLLMPFEQLEQLFNSMRAKNLDISAVQILGAADYQPLQALEQSILVDSETGEELQVVPQEYMAREYEHALQAHNTHLQEYFSAGRIAYTQVRSDLSLSEVILTRLSPMGILS